LFLSGVDTCIRYVRDLLALVAYEADPEKLQVLVAEINRILVERELGPEVIGRSDLTPAAVDCPPPHAFLLDRQITQKYAAAHC
jgi:hypothetical protein